MFGNKMSTIEKAVKKKNTKALIGLADGHDMQVHLAAIAGLGEVSGDDACNYLVSQLSSESPEVRVAVAQALGHIGDKHTKAFVKAQLAKETDPKVQEALTEALPKISNY